jgi:CRP-like cAMP-binding protein
MDRRAQEGQQDGSERLELVTGVGLFRDLPEGVRQEIAAGLRARAVDRDRVVFLVGKPASAVHFLAQGRVKVIRETDDGREVILRVIGPGEMFGASGIWGEAVYPATAVAIEDSVVLRMPAGRFASLMSSQPALGHALVRELGSRLREAEARILELQTERVERRIARVLIRLANKTGVKTAEGIEIGFPLSRQELADLVGSTLGTVSRTLSGWDQRGYVVAGRERVVLVKPHRLVAIADELG